MFIPYMYLCICLCVCVCLTAGLKIWFGMEYRYTAHSHTHTYTITHIHTHTRQQNPCTRTMGSGPADRVALVTAAPPSYTRMYHYFPAHLSAHPFCYYPPAPPPPPPPAPPTQLATPLTLKQLGNSLTSMTQAAQLAKTLRYAPGNNNYVV